MQQHVDNSHSILTLKQGALGQVQICIAIFTIAIYTVTASLRILVAMQQQTDEKYLILTLEQEALGQLQVCIHPLHL